MGRGNYFASFARAAKLCRPTPQDCLDKVGFRFVRCYRTVPSPINVELEANRYELTWKCAKLAPEDSASVVKL
jgi:hypothetical protein